MAKESEEMQLFTVCRPGQTSMSRSLKAVFWVFLLLFTLIYIGALFCASELGPNQKLKGVFGNIWISIFSHFKLMTLEQWVDICSLAMEVGAEQKGVDFFSGHKASWRSKITECVGVLGDHLALRGESCLGCLLPVFYHFDEPDPGESGNRPDHHRGGGTCQGR